MRVLHMNEYFPPALKFFEIGVPGTRRVPKKRIAGKKKNKERVYGLG